VAVSKDMLHEQSLRNRIVTVLFGALLGQNSSFTTYPMMFPAFLRPSCSTFDQKPACLPVQRWPSLLLYAQGHFVRCLVQPWGPFHTNLRYVESVSWITKSRQSGARGGTCNKEAMLTRWCMIGCYRLKYPSIGNSPTPPSKKHAPFHITSSLHNVAHNHTETATILYWRHVAEDSDIQQ